MYGVWAYSLNLATEGIDTGDSERILHVGGGRQAELYPLAPKHGAYTRGWGRGGFLSLQGNREGSAPGTEN